MAKNVLRYALCAIGIALGMGVVALIDAIIVALGGAGLHISLLTWALVLVYIAGALLFGIIFYLISPKIIDTTATFLRRTEEKLSTMPLMDIVFAVVGLVVGLLLALFVTSLLSNVPWPWLVTPISVVIYLLFGYLGIVTALRRREFRDTNLISAKAARDAHIARPKILDTSVIIDGRILDICQTGVVEGTLVVPNFVLQELRHIADNADALKRGRGRRGLDILQKMQKELSIPVKVEEKDYQDIAEVDLKLLRLAQDLNGVVVTNDYNLNKVAAVQNVPVFNINELANAIKPVLIPGEEMPVLVVKEGKEANQGVGYLEDGTMIVIEGGKRLIGEQVEAVVTSVLQTSAGRMIFARVK
ncbi:TRAM domain-containing protein [Eubacteriales bacterium OttesenSCG-928-K08]|nr:TRAM domain-containing protein [Eubacteriales bacterium OttesenSCG-928-K08]